MLYPDNIEEKLGFDIIRDWLKEFCQSEAGKEQVSKIRYSTKFPVIERLMGQTVEMKDILMQENFPFPKSIDAYIHLENCEVEGSYLEMEELSEIAYALESAGRIWEFLLSRQEASKHLYGLIRYLHFDKGITTKIRSVFDDKGEIRDDASPELKKIRKELKNADRTLHRSLENVFKQSRQKGYVPSDMTPTIRDGRLVIPVLAEHKRRIKGFVHDESSTGQTVYIEPSETLEANNAIKELHYAERREIIKILTWLTSLLQADMPAIYEAFKFLTLLDLILAKAKLSIELESEVPELQKSAMTHMMKARHPVLWRNYKASKKEVVPLGIDLDFRNRILIVSGPNAGGKSVCLKTTGLIQYMIQCGIPAPLHADSKIGIYEHIFVDIGDEQSIENDLSTYSSHLKNMNTILRHADDKSLILIDEFGTGTDPQFGGAIAEAILEGLTERKCQGVITTHYGNLKDFAQNHEGVANGAMQFDMDNLEPLYSLETGRPGSSFALEVAGKIGLDKKVLNKARDLIGTDSISLENLLNKLSHEKKVVSEKLREVLKKESELKEKVGKYDSLKNEIEEKKREIINRAKQDASDLLSNTNREIEKTIRHIKENKAQKSETQKVRSKLKDFKTKVEPDKKQKKSKEIKIIEGPIKVGDTVILVDSGVTGEVIELKGKNLVVSIGGLSMKTNLNKLRKIQAEMGPKSSNRVGLKGFDLAKKQADFSPKLDIRGKRTEEAISILDAYVDDALLLGHHEIKILHGTGDGILREMVRDFLNRVPSVVKLADEHIDQGGSGITLVTLK
jgi:DNA mismatch repair protein MutS2